MGRVRREVGVALLAAAGAAACSATDPSGLQLVEGSGVVFLVQGEPATEVMEALFQGDVVLDPAGCLRLGDGEGPTAVWPFGFTLAARSGELDVRDAEGRRVGTVGGAFRLGGGNVQELHAGIPLAQADRERAAGRCPGTWWIVGDVPVP